MKKRIFLFGLIFSIVLMFTGCSTAVPKEETFMPSFKPTASPTTTPTPTPPPTPTSTPTPEPTAEPEPEPTAEPAEPQAAGVYIGSSKSDKFHKPSCQWAGKILPENAVWFSGKDDAANKGYVGCKVCSP